MQYVATEECNDFNGNSAVFVSCNSVLPQASSKIVFIRDLGVAC